MNYPMDPKPLRLKENSNLALTFDSTYQGLPIQTRKGPLVVPYLERLYQTIQRAMAQHPRVLAIRCDLRLPDDPAFRALLTIERLMDRFISSLKEKINAQQQRKRREGIRTHKTSLRYVWAREIGQRGDPHYHLLLLLNRDAYYGLGEYDLSQDNLYSLITKAWASALGIPPGSAVGLVHFAKNLRGSSLFYLDSNRRDIGITPVFRAASYLCKAETKIYGDCKHAFGCSRR